jgi:hypothetical protein
MHRGMAYRLIRLALLVGVLVFGMVAWYVSSGRSDVSFSAESLTVFRLVFFALAITTLAGLIVVRSVQAKAADFERRASLAVIGWALAEGLALFGAVAFFLSGSASLYLLGLGVLVVALLVIPAPEQA